MLRFSPYAWAKLLFLRDLGDTEIGGFAIAPADDLLRVEDIRLVRQQCTQVSVKFHDDAVAGFFDQQVDEGRRPQQFARIWLHTHPCHSAQPSDIDEETFARCFGRSDWAVMFILARGAQTYTRLRFNAGPGGELEIASDVNFSIPFAASRQEAWEEEYDDNVSTGQIPNNENVWEPWGWQQDPDDDLVELANRELDEPDDEETAWLHWANLMDEPCEGWAAEDA